jgi:hypothetical protein
MEKKRLQWGSGLILQRFSDNTGGVLLCQGGYNALGTALTAMSCGDGDQVNAQNWCFLAGPANADLVGVCRNGGDTSTKTANGCVSGHLVTYTKYNNCNIGTRANQAKITCIAIGGGPDNAVLLL